MNICFGWSEGVEPMMEFNVKNSFFWDAAVARDGAAMVVSEQFPIFRLATLLARQLSSPIATRIKEYAKGHPRFGRTVCMRGGRAAAAAELRFKLWSLQVRPAGAALPALSDQRALDAGADLLGEMILFALGAAIVTYEFNRQAIKQEAKVLAEQSRWLAAQLQVEELRAELRAQQRDIDRLVALLRARAAPPPPPEPRAPSTPPPPPEPASPPAPPATAWRAPPAMCPCPELSTDPPL